jgi:hypothetical protein
MAMGAKIIGGFQETLLHLNIELEADFEQKQSCIDFDFS